MRHSEHQFFRVTAALGLIAAVFILIAIGAHASKHDGIAVTSTIIGCVFGIGFWFRFTANIAEITILDLLQGGGWHSGIDLINRSDGVLQYGTVYVHLMHLQKQGLIRSRLPSITERQVSPPPDSNHVQQQSARRLYSLVINRPPLVAGKDTP